MNRQIPPFARRIPWWLILLLGIACVVVGATLVGRPFRSLSVMVWLIQASLILIGLGRLAAAGASARPRLSALIGLGWIVAGLVAIVFPGLTLQALTLVVGIVLLVSGAARLLSALFGDPAERLVLALRGLANLLFGLLALTAPAATVLALALLFGLYLVIFGIRQIGLALRLRRSATDATATAAKAWPRSWRLAGTVAALLTALLGVALSVGLRAAQPGVPGPFYAAPATLPDGPTGTIIRSEVVDGFHQDATTHRVLYTSTGFDGQPTAVSGLIIVPNGDAPAAGRKVVAWTHGTVGVAPNCAPSLVPGALYAPALPALDAFVKAGYVLAATDYQGLGTPGPNPFLIGASEGANALDSVRAAVNLPGANASRDFVVWGESQGGHASLFTGQLAATYAPELNLLGVVASAPAADLLDLFQTKITEGDAVGNLLISMAATSWSRVYDDVSLDQIVYPAARSLVASIADNCIQNPQQIQRSIPAATLLNALFFSRPPWEVDAWSKLISENTPGGMRTAAPILIVQGDADPIISPAVQAQFAAKLCAAGDSVEYRTYPGIGHLTISHEVAPEVVQWIANRFAGVAAETTCP